MLSCRWHWLDTRRLLEVSSRYRKAWERWAAPWRLRAPSCLLIGDVVQSYGISLTKSCGRTGSTFVSVPVLVLYAGGLWMASATTA